MYKFYFIIKQISSLIMFLTNELLKTFFLILKNNFRYNYYFYSMITIVILINFLTTAVDCNQSPTYTYMQVSLNGFTIIIIKLLLDKNKIQRIKNTICKRHESKICFP